MFELNTLELIKIVFGPITWIIELIKNLLATTIQPRATINRYFRNISYGPGVVLLIAAAASFLIAFAPQKLAEFTGISLPWLLLQMSAKSYEVIVISWIPSMIVWWTYFNNIVKVIGYYISALLYGIFWGTLISALIKLGAT